ncbi:hypothetical protein C8R44DRAFT_866947 [Mycena epipterygia]|nr:hypothetical protein C8R44DRAFT_866947 [Mycena epipterygia]
MSRPTLQDLRFHYPLPEDTPCEIPFVEGAVGVAFSVGLFHVSTGPTLMEPSPSVPNGLTAVQQAIYDRVVVHLRATLAGERCAPLRIIVRGMCGTGKTLLLNNIAGAFAEHGVPQIVAKLAPTGIAAGLIDGQTLHSWAKFPPHYHPHPFAHEPQRTHIARLANVVPVQYLLIDHYSGIGKRELALLSDAMSYAKQGSVNGEAFGGSSVVLFGDMARFPPISTSNALFTTLSARESGRDGLRTYRLFKTVYDLVERPASTNAVWDGLLGRVRVGACTESDIYVLRSLILTPGHAPDFAEGPWRNAILITSRYSLLRAWNALAVIRHSAEANETVWITPALDEPIREPVVSATDMDRIACLPINKTAHLAGRLEIVVGLKMSAVVAGRTLVGIVTQVQMDEREIDDNSTQAGQRRYLRFPLAAVWLQSLDAGAGAAPIRLAMERRKFKWEREEGRDIMLMRSQYCLAPAYAVLSHKAEGITYPYVIADMAHPPRGRATRSHMYAALSAGQQVRILRDFDDSVLTAGLGEALDQHERLLDDLRFASKL